MVGTSWQLRAATALVGLAAVPGVLACGAGVRLLGAEPGLLFLIEPLVGLTLLGLGVSAVAGAIALACSLHLRRPAARLRAGAFAVLAVAAGLALLGLAPAAGAVVLGHGAVLLLLLATGAVAADLGPWLPRQTAPWGSTPGRGLWAPLPPAPSAIEPAPRRPPWQPDAPQQGPWSPDPTTLPWFSWRRHSGPRPPWWRTWEAGLARGLPVWEALVLGGALVGFVVLLALSLADTMAWVLLLPVPLLGVMGVETRVRQRLSRG